MGSMESILATSGFTGSIKVIGWQSGAPNTREHDFPKKKKRPDFLKFVEPVTPIWFL